MMAQHPEHKVYYWDQRLCPGREPGSFVALFWTHDLVHKTDLPVHIRVGRIDDPNLAKEPPRQTSIPGQIAAPLLLDDGRLAAFVVDRNRPGTMKLWRSPDGGTTWPADDCLTVHNHDEQARLTQGTEGIDFNQYWEDMAKWSFGHPAIRQYDERRVLLTYYAGTSGCLSIHAAVVRVD